MVENLARSLALLLELEHTGGGGKWHSSTGCLEGDDVAALSTKGEHD
jgi:hypothetical protein